MPRQGATCEKEEELDMPSVHHAINHASLLRSSALHPLPQALYRKPHYNSNDCRGQEPTVTKHRIISGELPRWHIKLGKFVMQMTLQMEGGALRGLHQ